MMQRYMSNTVNAVRHLAVPVRSDIYMKCNIYSDKKTTFRTGGVGGWGGGGCRRLH